MTEVAYLEFEDIKPRDITLLDAQGRIVREWNSVQTETHELTDISLSAGTYTVLISMGSKKSALKLMVE